MKEILVTDPLKRASLLLDTVYTEMCEKRLSLRTDEFPALWAFHPVNSG